MRPNPQEIADLVAFTEEILDGKLHFFVQCELCQSKKQHVKGSSRAVVITISLFFCVTTSSQFKPSCGTVLKCTAREKGQDKGIDGKSYKKQYNGWGVPRNVVSSYQIVSMLFPLFIMMDFIPKKL